MLSWPFRSRRLRVLALLVAWCGALLVARALYTGRPAFGFLVWNLFLAGLPALAALGFVRAEARRTAAWVRLAWFAAWLLLLPNAPYILTDLVHLAPWHGVPLWYDIAVYLSFGGTGLLLGYASIADVQGAVARRRGEAAGWVVAVATLALCGFGIYLGRFARWNSWDVLASPIALLGDLGRGLASPQVHPRTAGFSAVWGAGLVLGYLALRVLGPPPEEEGTRR